MLGVSADVEEGWMRWFPIGFLFLFFEPLYRFGLEK